MTDKDVVDILIEELQQNKSYLSDQKTMVVVFGMLGDFDSIEYGKLVGQQLPGLQQKGIDFKAFAIGNEKSLDRFCHYTGIPVSNVYMQTDAKLHNKLNLHYGPKLGFGNLVNMLIMCAGIDSPGTLKEVIRGYLGDKNSKAIYSTNKDEANTKQYHWIANLFNLIGKDNSLRPFEMATYRLFNMIEVISNWRIYFPNHDHICQRGATFLINEDNNLIYSYRCKGLLCFSQNSSAPLSFLEPWLQN